MRKDGAGQPYVEIQSWELDDGDEYIRLTYVANGPHDPVIRIRVRQTDGRLRQGPDIALSSAHQFIGAIQDLLAFAREE